MSGEKRPASGSFSSGQMVKRARADNDSSNAVGLSSGSNALVPSGPPHGLAGPVMELSGHSREVFAARFDPTGQHIASGGMDRRILLWNSFGDCKNYGAMDGHKGAVMDLQWSRDARTLFSASADTLLASWDTETGQRLRRYIGHDDVVNAMDVSKRGEELVISACDDYHIGLWDPRKKTAVDYIETDAPVTAVALNEAGSELYSGSLDSQIRVWDLRKKTVLYCMNGHTDTISSLQVAPDGQSLLSNSFDSTVRTWNIQPFAPENRQMRVYEGAPRGVEMNLLKASWDATGERIAAGSGDATTVVWEVRTGKMLRKLPGHRGAVNDVRFAPDGTPLIVSASSDSAILLGELGK